MPTPNPEPTPAQIVKVAEITLLSTAEVSEMIAADDDQDIADAKWELTLADIELWDGSIRDEANDVKKVGGIEFFEGVAGQTRLSVRNRIRARYGKAALRSEGDSGVSVISTLSWF